MLARTYDLCTRPSGPIGLRHLVPENALQKFNRTGRHWTYPGVSWFKHRDEAGALLVGDVKSTRIDVAGKQTRLRAKPLPMCLGQSNIFPRAYSVCNCLPDPRAPPPGCVEMPERNATRQVDIGRIRECHGSRTQMKRSRSARRCGEHKNLCREQTGTASWRLDSTMAKPLPMRLGTSKMLLHSEYHD